MQCAIVVLPTLEITMDDTNSRPVSSSLASSRPVSAKAAVKAKRGIVVNVNFFFVGMMLCYLTLQLLFWVFNHLVPG